MSNALGWICACLDWPLCERVPDSAVSSDCALKNEGGAPQPVTVTTVGVPTYKIQSGGYGYQLSRQYFTMEGVEVTGAQVATGDRFVTVLTVTPSSKVGARLMVNDPLPAGFEIDNPNLLSSGDVRALDWLQPTYAEHSEFRSDRFLAAVDWQSAQPFRLAYIVRPVSPG